MHWELEVEAGAGAGAGGRGRGRGQGQISRVPWPAVPDAACGPTGCFAQTHPLLTTPPAESKNTTQFSKTQNNVVRVKVYIQHVIPPLAMCTRYHHCWLDRGSIG
jgi:hypothetical protein